MTPSSSLSLSYPSMPTFEVITEKNHQGMGKEIADLFHKRLEGKVAIITGGAHGIGKATARLFDKHGAKVIIADIDVVAGESLSASLSPSAAFIRCDVTQEADVEHVIQCAVSRHGRLDILCNIAGILGRQTAHHRTIMELDADEFDRVMRVNVRGAALGMKHAARAMVPARSGCIVSMASVAGVLGGLGPHAYTASKHAIVGLTKNAACELGVHGVRVNCISPFGVATRMLINAWKEEEDGEEEEDKEEVVNPSEEEVKKTEEFVRSLANLKAATLTAKDIAEAALYLVSDESKYVSGHNLVVDGGITTSTNLIGL